MNKVECPRPAYDRLERAGIVNLLFGRKRKSIHDLFLYQNYLGGGSSRRVLDWAKGIGFDASFEEHRVAKDILELDAELTEKADSFAGGLHDVEDLLVEYPSFLACFVLGKNVSKFERFGFPTRRSLEESVASLCVGEQPNILFSRDHYFWRTGNSKNVIALNMHGDLHAGQTDVSGAEGIENTLFGEIDSFDTIKQDPNYGAVNAYQDWSQFLVASLRYAEQVGIRDMHEIVNWQEVLEETGAVGTATAEAFGVCGGDGSNSFFDDESIAR